MNRFYQVHQFAELAGVTVKALHHYDRLGLLKPGRTDAGYRMYAQRDLERLEQIVALKFLGLPLKQIKVVLDRAELELPDALKMQRKAIEEKQAMLCRALRAICAAEQSLEPGKPADPAILKKIIEVIDMQDGIAEMKKFYSDAAWEMRKRFYEEGPSPEWRELYRDVGEMLGEDPGSDKAQAVAERWVALSLRAHSGDLSVPNALRYSLDGAGTLAACHEADDCGVQIGGGPRVYPSDLHRVTEEVLQRPGMGEVAGSAKEGRRGSFDVVAGGGGLISRH